MHDITRLETELNALAQKGEMATAVSRYYAPQCRFQEGNQPPREGSLEGQLAYLEAFFKTVTAVNAIRLHAQAVGQDVSISEWTFDLSTTNGPVLWNEVIRRQWQDGKVVSERYYTAA